MLTHRLPYPPDRGDRIRSYHMLRTLCEHFDMAIACTSERIFERLARAMGREEMVTDPRYATGVARVEHREEVDAAVSEWTGAYDMKELVGLLDAQEVPVSPINSIADIFEDPQFRARGSIIEIDDPVLGKAKTPDIVPRLSRTPGRVERFAPALGQHNDEVYGRLLGYGLEKLAELKEEGVI